MAMFSTHNRMLLCIPRAIEKSLTVHAAFGMYVTIGKQPWKGSLQHTPLHLELAHCHEDDDELPDRVFERCHDVQLSCSPSVFFDQ